MIRNAMRGPHGRVNPGTWARVAAALGRSPQAVKDRAVMLRKREPF